jgi:hypothetical protein
VRGVGAPDLGVDEAENRQQRGQNENQDRHDDGELRCRHPIVVPASHN